MDDLRFFENLGQQIGGTAAMSRCSLSGVRRELRDAIRCLRRKTGSSVPESIREDSIKWYRENAGMIETEGQTAYRALTGAKRLPGKKEPNLFKLLSSYVDSGREEMSAEQVSALLRGYAKTAYLSEKELSCLYSLLCAAIIRKLAHLRKSMGEDEALWRERTPDVSRCIRMLHAMRTGALEELPLLHNPLERLLRMDRSGEYPALDRESRARWRALISEEAERARLRPDEYAKRLMTEYPSVCDGLARLDARRAPKGRWYIPLQLLLTAAITAAACRLGGQVWLIPLMILPIWECVKNLLDLTVLHRIPPRRLPRLALTGGIPEEGKTLCVITSLLIRPGDGEKLARRLYEFSLANRECGDNLLFGVLADLPDAPQAVIPEDEKLLSEARKAIDRYNVKTPRFFLLSRPRSVSKSDGRYLGWERKRGALNDLFDTLRGNAKIEVYGGTLPSNVKYVLTLDSDTRAEPYSILPMVGTMLCPQNRPVIGGGRVRKGYAIAQPRMAIDLEAANRSAFARIFSGNGGCDPYGSVAGDLYNDLFGEAIFTGKGLIDVDAYREVLGDRLPDNRILSHDLLESAYLRCAYLGDVEMTDGCPAAAPAYFSRLARWIRGDVQIFAWALPRVPGKDGSERNPLNALSRFKIADNLRRALTEPAIFALLVIACFSSGALFRLALFGTAVGLWLPAVAAAIIGEIGRPDARARKFRSAVLGGIGGLCLRMFTVLCLLPIGAAGNMAAILRAVWSLLTGKGRLRWTTAGETEGKKVNMEGMVRLCFPCLTAAAILLGGNPLAWSVGALFSLSPVLALVLSKTSKKRLSISEKDRDRLLSYAKDIWRFFSDVLGPKDHFLMPDNLQIEPCTGLAHRSSPTDIGFGLCAVLCAMDLEFIAPEEGETLVSNILAGIEKAPKWRGHLFNWIATENLTALAPRTVSAVDSGNLMAALLLCRVFAEEKSWEKIADRCDRLCRAMDFHALYDERRDLFSIGYYPDEGKRMGGYYDLLASEFRLTGFLCAAFGAAGPRFWGRLGRGLTGRRGYAGLVSWSGSMFEYLMPELFLPVFDNSLLWESARFCIAQQRKWRPGRSRLWGASESGYAAFDRHMAYQYKAHGVPVLAMKSGLWEERVFSPYSVFLALPYAPGAAMDCLKRFSSESGYGKYGFYEAFDFTQNRIGNRKYEVVASYMAHHMGMCLLSAHTLLCEEKMRKRMQSIPEVAAFSGLLKERLPVGGRLMQRIALRVADRKREPMEYAEQTGGVEESPEGMLFSNGAYTLQMTETGMSEATYNGLSVYRCDRDRFYGLGGVYGWIRTESGMLPFWEIAGKEKDIRFRCVRSSNSAVFESSVGQISAVTEVYVLRTAACEIREIRLINASASAIRGDLMFYLELLLCPREEYLAHPTYKRLFLSFSEESGAALVRRKSGEEALWCAVKVIGCDASYTCDREEVWGREGLQFGEDSPRRRRQWSPNPCVAARANLIIPAGTDVKIRLVISTERSKEGALWGAFLAERPMPDRADPIFSALRVKRKEGEQWHSMAQRISARLLTGHIGGQVPEIVPKDAVRALWTLGISGEKPLLLARTNMDGSMDPFPLYCFAMYRRAAIPCEMAVICSDTDAYLCPSRQAVLDIAAEFGITPASGLYTLQRRMLDETTIDALSMAAYIDFTALFSPKRIDRGKPDRFPASREQMREPENGELSTIPEGHLPPFIWSSVLAGPRFGCIMQDNGPGEMWYGNARLFRLTDWTMDPLGDNSQEEVFFSDGSRAVSLFAANGEQGSVQFELGCCIYEKRADGIRVRTTAFCPMEIPARIFCIEGWSEIPIRLIWRIRPLLGEKESHRAFLIQRNGTEGGLLYENAGNLFYQGQKLLCVSDPPFASASPPATGSDAVGEMCSAPVQGSFRICLVAGVCSDREEEKTLAALAEKGFSESEMEQTKAYYKNRCTILRLFTPHEELNRYISAACLYQTLACRFFGRASLWQSGGGYGFRDQLQDVCALCIADPDLSEEMLALAGSRQYEEGDVMHWWHELTEGCRGVRTRCSDDLLWLPYAVSVFIQTTGRTSVLRREICYLHSAPLEHGERSRYETPEVSGRKESLLVHCIRACDALIERGFGAHGLPLRLYGDWNDGMDAVGRNGNGESVWLAFFASDVFRRTAAMCRMEGNEKKAEELMFFSESMAQAALACKAGKLYLRAFDDEGRPLGNGEGEGAVDSLPQAFSTIVPQGDPGEKKAAVCEAVERLFDQEHNLIKLLDPPFSPGPNSPGYIADYPPGVRENGGQYTHGAIWLAMACFAVGEGDLGWRLLSALLPSARPEKVRKTEDFVLTADVYSHPDCVGQGGWSWYTGAAGWYFQAVLYCMIGLRAECGRFSFQPFIPSEWTSWDVVLRIGKGLFHIRAERGERFETVLDGTVIENGFDPWRMEGEHSLLLAVPCKTVL